MEQRHRIFIAINLPDNIKKTLAKFQEKYPKLPAKWTRQDNLHITLSFLGYLTNEEILETIKTAKDAAKKTEPFEIKINKVCCGPLNKPAKMVWATGEESKEFSDLKKALNGSQERSSVPHITLARILQWQFRRIEPEEVPQIDEDIDLNFSMESIDVMESELKKGGPRYFILESIPLS